MEKSWNRTRDALGGIAQYALDFNADTVEVRFFNSDLVYVRVKVLVCIFALEKVTKRINRVPPSL